MPEATGRLACSQDCGLGDKGEICGTPCKWGVKPGYQLTGLAFFPHMSRRSRLLTPCSLTTSLAASEIFSFKRAFPAPVARMLQSIVKRRKQQELSSRHPAFREPELDFTSHLQAGWLGVDLEPDWPCFRTRVSDIPLPLSQSAGGMPCPCFLKRNNWGCSLEG